mmetsp:Transcript_17537/g.25952  ORF Transcript_17537/g.25952 Transcript_17537/m.25952 type:complete len:359 (+) Transcript_17537:178-1254(+)
MLISNYYAGAIGLCLSLFLLFLASWRALYHFCSNRSWINRRAFHGLFFLAMAVEALAYADLSGLIHLSSSSVVSARRGYILLELLGRSFLEVITYSVVTLIWLEAVRKSVGKWGRASLLFCVVLLFSACVFQAFEMSKIPEKELLWVYQLHLLVEGFCWFLHGFAAVACSFWTTRQIVRLSVFPQIDRSQQIQLLVKALLPMVLCGVCYGLRAIWLLSTLFQNRARTPTQERDSWSWWIGFEWLPTLIPSLMLLYSTRKRDEQSENNYDNVPLFSPIGPPVEAFVNFQNFHSLFSPSSLREHDADEAEDGSHSSYRLLSSQSDQDSDSEKNDQTMRPAAQLMFKESPSSNNSVNNAND